MVNIYECRICSNLHQKGVKGFERFTGTRKMVRKHLVDEHNVKGRSRWHEKKDKDFKSRITAETIVRKWR